jgi:predicted anti-sigma-YlaC factor YlaD
MAMNCTHALRLIDLVVDGMADDGQKRMLRFHLMGCPSCRAALQMTNDLSQLVIEISQPEVPEDLLEKVRARLAINDFPSMKTGKSKFRKLALALPAAAAILIFVGIGSFDKGTARSGSAIGITKVEIASDKQISKISYTTSPFISYSRPSTLTSF